MKEASERAIGKRLQGTRDTKPFLRASAGPTARLSRCS